MLGTVRRWQQEGKINPALAPELLFTTVISLGAGAVFAHPQRSAFTGGQPPDHRQPRAGVDGPRRRGLSAAAARQMLFVARIRRHAPPSRFSARATLSRATTSMLIPGRLRSRYFFCAMSLMAQGAHRGRPVAAAPCTPGLRPAKSPLRGPFDLSLQASGRAEAASVQNTALSPHPCGLPRPSGNVSAILRPPAPAVSVAQVGISTTGRTTPEDG